MTRPHVSSEGHEHSNTTSSCILLCSCPAKITAGRLVNNYVSYTKNACLIWRSAKWLTRQSSSTLTSSFSSSPSLFISCSLTTSVMPAIYASDDKLRTCFLNRFQAAAAGLQASMVRHTAKRNDLAYSAAAIPSEVAVLHACMSEACVYWFGDVPVHLQIGFRDKVLPVPAPVTKSTKSSQCPARILWVSGFTLG